MRDFGKDKVNFKDSIERNTTSMQDAASIAQKKKYQYHKKIAAETVVLSANIVTGPATLASREPEPGALTSIFRMRHSN